MHQALVQQPGSRIRRLAGSRAKEMQFHRVLRNEKVSVAEMAAQAGARTGLRAQDRDIVVIQDTCEIMVGGHEAGRAGFGPIGKGGATRGVLLHAAIAVDTQGALLGLVDETVWTRRGGRPQADRRRAFAEKESYRWLAACGKAAARLNGARSITMVSDAESDIYELIAACPKGLHFLIRAARDRQTASGVLLSQAVDELAGEGEIEGRIAAAPGRAERLATLCLRFGEVGLQAPKGTAKASPRSVCLRVLDVQEPDPPEGVKPLAWRLLTSHAIPDAAQAAAMVDLYRSRFLIEQVFRPLKTAGFNIEEAELAEPKALIAFTGLALIAAVTPMQLVKARDGGSGQTLSDCFEPQDQPLLLVLSVKLEGKTQKQRNPHPPAALAFASWVIAGLGGWTGYYGKPGPAVMRYGLDRFHAIKLGAKIAKDV